MASIKDADYFCFPFLYLSIFMFCIGVLFFTVARYVRNYHGKPFYINITINGEILITDALINHHLQVTSNSEPPR
jgi:hypothetical protein